ncbi:hypothetical protein BGZ94_005711 [Podila epigama]|nr:hypothetical protein BGZ94_005711 [Podila epigama]
MPSTRSCRTTPLSGPRNPAGGARTLPVGRPRDLPLCTQPLPRGGGGGILTGARGTAGGREMSYELYVAMSSADLPFDELHVLDITDAQAIYIINNVLIPRVLYRLTCTTLSPSVVRSLVSKYMTVVRSKAILGRHTPNSILFHRQLFGSATPW